MLANALNEMLTERLKANEDFKSKDLLAVKIKGAIIIYGPNRSLTDRELGHIATITYPSSGVLKVEYFPSIALPYKIVIESVINSLIFLKKVEITTYNQLEGETNDSP